MMFTSKPFTLVVASLLLVCATSSLASPLPQRNRGNAASQPVLPPAPSEPELEVEGLNLNTISGSLPGGTGKELPIPEEVAAGLIV
ncbi:hypothetical protein SCHPADRAFT_909673 [Schizopora paradoxa]|uniref:Secreted protein n=1 Tax=Schizopora paradoxa TaxID=27342 RepID=A0A0H2RCK3_9AGAM|nr:hypothetical protein SCHPADRAFT_909673 [Schizopora paradoxa]